MSERSGFNIGRPDHGTCQQPVSGVTAFARSSAPHTRDIDHRFRRRVLPILHGFCRL